MFLKEGVTEGTILKMYMDELFFLREVPKYLVIFSQTAPLI